MYCIRVSGGHFFNVSEMKCWSWTGHSQTALDKVYFPTSFLIFPFDIFLTRSFVANKQCCKNNVQTSTNDKNIVTALPTEEQQQKNENSLTGGSIFIFNFGDRQHPFLLILCRLNMSIPTNHPHLSNHNLHLLTILVL